MKKLILITALSICNISTAMDNNEKIQLGSEQEIEAALYAKDPRLSVFAHSTRVRSLANRITTPNSLEHAVTWAKVEDLSDTLNDCDVQDATAAIVTTGKRAKL